MEEMINSVREKGIITPLLVSRTESGYQLIAGERRWRAAQKAGLESVPVVVREATPVESMELALIVFERNEIAVIEKREEIVDADHRAPFIQEVEVKDQLVDAFKTDLTRPPHL